MDATALQATFLQEAAVRLPLGSSYATVRCPDQWVGTVDKDAKVTRFKEGGRLAGREPMMAQCPRLIIVLESPHTDEFNGRDTARGPAQGPTGVNIEHQLALALGADLHLIAEPHQLLLVNAVQYQCSLGEATSEHRDVMFVKLWKSGGHSEFETRMHSYIQPGDIVINACTRGPKNEPLRSTVDVVLAEVVKQRGAALLRRTHPSSRWWRKATSWQA